MSRFEDKVEQSLSQVNKNVRKVFSSGQTTADYIPFESLDRVKVHSLATKALSKRTSKWGLKRRHVTYWLMAFAIGLLTGVFAFFSSMGLSTVQKVRIAISLYFLNLFEDSAAGIFMAWLTFSMSSVILVITGSTLCTYVQPTAKGAGIAEVKAFLNGVKFPNFFSLRTLFVKLIAAICAVGGGLPMGQEGPMIHIGAMIGWNTSQMKFRKFPRLSMLFQKFQNDRDKRDFVASGAASGVAAAFGAPIGGTLFAFEEASSFWSMELIWRTFFACMVSTWSANFFIMGATEGLWKVIDQPSHVVYGVTLGKSYRVWEIFPFLLIGVIGGILGVLFIQIWKVLVPLKKKYIWTSNRNKVIEVAVLAFVVSSLAILLPLAFGCEPYSKIHPEDSIESSDESANEAFAFQIFNCKEGEYNQMASLWFTSPELTLKHLFVRNVPDALSVGPLLTFLILFLLAAAYGCGTWIAGGLLVPMLMIGATYGRLVGVITSKILPDSGVDPGVYAVLGATGFMGGVSRLTVAMVLIMIEITSDLDALLPIMLVSMISKWVGDLFCHSLYDEQLHVNHVPFLEADPPRLASSMLVNEAMHGDIGFVNSNATVSQCVKAVAEFKYSDIPVVDAGSEGTGRYLVGSVPRVHLVTLLADRVWDDKKQRLMDVTTGERRFKAGIPKFVFSDEDLQSHIDLSPYINMATFSVQEMFPLSLAYKVFRDQGLRQLFVVSDNNELVGMLNRDNLLLHEQHDSMIKNTSKAHERERMIQRKASILNQSSGNLNASRPTTPKREHVEISVASPNVSLNNNNK